MITLKGSAMVVRVDTELGAEIIHVGPDLETNVLFFDEWLTPLRAQSSTSYGDGALDWLSDYRGGWQELFPNGGAACSTMGVPLPFHGEVSRAVWEVIHQTPGQARLRTATRLPLLVHRTMTVDLERAVLRIEEVVQNESALDVDFIWGHHPAFRLGPEATIDLPAGRIQADAAEASPLTDVRPGATGTWPRIEGMDGSEVDLRNVPAGAVERLVYASDLEAGWAAARDIQNGIGVAMAWDQAVFPHLWMWQQIGGPGFPWFGRARITALEPQSSWPADGLTGAVARGQEHHLGPHETLTTWLTMALFEPTTQAVTGMSRDGDITTQAGGDR